MEIQDRVKQYLLEGKTQAEAINLAYSTYYKENPPQQYQQGGGVDRFKKKSFQLEDERNQVQRDATQVIIQKTRPIQQLNVRNKTDKEIAAEREAKIKASEEAQKVAYTKENWRKQLAAETAATGDKLRVSNEPNFFDDYINPAVMVGNMVSNLGQAPLQTQQSGSNLPYFTAIGAPLVTGALAGLGTQNTGQFVNNLTNPLAGIRTSIPDELRQGLNIQGISKNSNFDDFSKIHFENNPIRGEDAFKIKKGDEWIGDFDLEENWEKPGEWTVGNVGLNGTNRGMGFGKQAYIKADEILKNTGRGSLHSSGNFIGDDAKRVWESLVKSGKAEQIEKDVWRFKDVYQSGGTVKKDQEWLQNWYGNRVIPNQEVNPIFQKYRNDYEDISHSVPNPVYKGYIPVGDDIKDLSAEGVHTRNNEIFLRAPENETTYLHEGDHHIYENASSPEMDDIHNNIVKYNLAPKENINNPSIKENYDYYSQPTEVHARIQELRKKAGFKPTQEIKEKDLENFKKTYKGETEGINNLFDMTDTPHLLELLNSMAENSKNSKSNIFYAQQGGIYTENEQSFINDYFKQGGEKYTQNELNFIKELSLLK